MSPVFACWLAKAMTEPVPAMSCQKRAWDGGSQVPLMWQEIVPEPLPEPPARE